MLFHTLHCFTNPVVCQDHFREAQKKCSMVLLMAQILKEDSTDFLKFSMYLLSEVSAPDLCL